MWLGERFCEYVCPIVFGSDFMHFKPALFDLVSKMVPFYGEMFGTWTVFIAIHCKGEGSGVVLKDDRISKFVDA